MKCITLTKKNMRILESHEILLVAGGLQSFDPNGWLAQYESGYQFDDNAIMGDSFSDLMMNADHNAALMQLQHFDISFAPYAPDASFVASVTAAILGIIGINTGFDPSTGLRMDGLPAGSGCGNRATDWIVPDSIFGINVLPECKGHDTNYANQIGKDNADNIFRQDVYNSSIRQGAPEWAAAAISWVYYQAVHHLGQGAYDAAGQTP